MSILPATGTEITMGRIRKSYNNVAPAASQNISLAGVLGSYIGYSSGAITVSSAFGGRTNPYTY